MKKNETQCVEHIISLQNVAFAAIQNRKFTEAEAAFLDITCGIEKLSDLDKEYYEPPLYAALFYLAKIYAFGLLNRWTAVNFITKACSVARRCTESDRADYETAKSDLEQMMKLLYQLEIGEPLSELGNEFGEDILKPSKKAEFLPDDTVSGLGCLAGFVILIVFCVLYLIVASQINFFAAGR